MRLDEYEKQREVIKADLQGKFAREDWHGVADAAMDLRDLAEYFRGYRDGWIAGLDQAP